MDSIENDIKKKLFKELGKKIKTISSKDCHHAWCLATIERASEVAKKNEEAFKKEIAALVDLGLGVKMDENDYEHPVAAFDPNN